MSKQTEALLAIWEILKDEFPNGTGADYNTYANDEYLEAVRKVEKAIAELEVDEWITVVPTKHPTKTGEYLLLFGDGKIGVFDVILEEGDDWEDDEGNPKRVETARCYVPWLGQIAIGEDDCVTHYKPITRPKIKEVSNEL